MLARLIRIHRIQWCCSPFLFLSQNTLFGQICSKNSKIVSLSWNSMMLLTFSFFHWKKLSWTNLVQKLKIVSFSWNLLHRLIQICRTLWWYSPFLFSTRSKPFGLIWSKKKNNNNKTVSWSWNLIPRLIWICRIELWRSFFVFFDWKYSFWANWAKKIKIDSLSWNLVPRLILRCRI